MAAGDGRSFTQDVDSPEDTTGNEKWNFCTKLRTAVEAEDWWSDCWELNR